MSEVLKGPFSKIITKVETEYVLITEEPEHEGEIYEVGEYLVNQRTPSSLTYEHGVTIKDTPDGEMTQPVIIWRAKWNHEENDSTPLLEPLCLQ